MTEITTESLAGAVAYMISNPDKLSPEQKTALSGVVAQPKPAAAQPVVETPPTETSRQIASSLDKANARIKELETTLEQNKEMAKVAIESSLQTKDQAYMNEINSERERNAIITSLYAKVPRHIVDQLVSTKKTTDNLKYAYELFSMTGASKAGIARGLEIQSSTDKFRNDMEKMSIPEVTFKNGGD